MEWAPLDETVGVVLWRVIDVCSTKLYNSTAFILALYVLWASINAYFFDAPPSERFQHIVDYVTPPKHVTVGEFRERKCADTIGTVPLSWAGRFRC